MDVSQPEDVSEWGCRRLEVPRPRAEEADALHVHEAPPKRKEAGYPAAASDCQRWNALPSLSVQAANQPCVGTGIISSA